jgi:phosphatidylglycerophosphate synthase
MSERCRASDVYARLVKPWDGPVSKYINRRVSLNITCFLINHNIRPSPHRITLFTTLIGILSALVILYNPVIGGVLVEFTSILDGVDGEIARLTGRTSRYGAFLDSMLDRIVDVTIISTTSYFLLEILDPVEALYLSLWLLSSSILVSYMHARGEASLNKNLQLIGWKIYAGRDVRLFLISLALIIYPFSRITFFSIIVFLSILQSIYVGYKIIVAHGIGDDM